jgi:hypothetical protein
MSCLDGNSQFAEQLSLDLPQRQSLKWPIDREIWTMGEKIPLKSRHLKVIVAVVVCVFAIWLMSVLKCGMITPAY